MQWQFRRLSNSSEIKLAELHKMINNIIVYYSAAKGTESNANQIMDKLWLGNCKAAHDDQFISTQNIKHVVNATDSITNKFSNIEYTTFAIKDSDACKYNLFYLLDYGADIIHDALSKNETVLVHCKNGHHRSASIVAFYLMKYHGFPLANAVYFIKTIRPTAFRRINCLLRTLIYYSIYFNLEKINKL